MEGNEIRQVGNINQRVIDVLGVDLAILLTQDIL